MIKLPENKPTEFNKTPRIFFVWGESMSGKTFFARQFPNPILLNTDGNADKVDTPSIKINDFKHFVEIIETLETVPHTFETIIIDLIDDIDLLLNNYVCEKLKVENIADAAYGKGFGEVKNIWKNLMMKLSTLKFNLVFISHIITTTENNNSVSVPSLPEKALNACLGRCDLQIQTKKLGTNYMKIITNKRDTYLPGDIKNPIIAKALEGTIGLFEKPIIATPITPNLKNNTTIKNTINEGNDK